MALGERERGCSGASRDIGTVRVGHPPRDSRAANLAGNGLGACPFPLRSFSPGAGPPWAAGAPPAGRAGGGGARWKGEEAPRRLPAAPPPPDSFRGQQKGGSHSVLAESRRGGLVAGAIHSLLAATSERSSPHTGAAGPTCLPGNSRAWASGGGSERHSVGRGGGGTAVLPWPGLGQVTLGAVPLGRARMAAGADARLLVAGGGGSA